jgi:hypothetical protein
VDNEVGYNQGTGNFINVINLLNTELKKTKYADMMKILKNDNTIKRKKIH